MQKVCVQGLPSVVGFFGFCYAVAHTTCNGLTQAQAVTGIGRVKVRDKAAPQRIDGDCHPRFLLEDCTH